DLAWPVHNRLSIAAHRDCHQCARARWQRIGNRRSIRRDTRTTGWLLSCRGGKPRRSYGHRRANSLRTNRDGRGPTTRRDCSRSFRVEQLEPRIYNLCKSVADIEQVFREEYGRIIATLIRISGSFDLAEEALQEAFIAAVSKWELEGSPDNPGAWLTTVAHRKLLDALRRDRTRTDKQAELTYEVNRLRPY